MNEPRVGGVDTTTRPTLQRPHGAESSLSQQNFAIMAANLFRH